VAQVDSSGGNTIVTLNGQTEVFYPSDGPIFTVNYSGDQHVQGGHDTFINNTGLSSNVSMYGGSNVVMGGSGWDWVLVSGGNNTVNTRGGGGYVYAYGSSGDDLSNSSDASVYTFNWDPYPYSKLYS